MQDKSQITLMFISLKLDHVLLQTINAEDYLKRETSSFDFAEIKSSRVYKLLSKLDITKATGVDRSSNKVLKLAAPLIYKQLTELFNLSLKSGE